MTTSRAARHRAEPHEPDDDRDLVRQYLNQIAATPLLTAEEEVQLAKRIEAGVYAAELLRSDELGERPAPAERHELEAVVREGQRAKDRMIRSNLRLVVATAKKHLRRGLPFLDVIQEGNLGLMRAVEKFDYAKGYKFSTYAVWWIRQSIERGVAEHSRVIRLPVYLVEELAKLGRIERRFRLRVGRDPTEEELAEEAETSVNRVAELRLVGREAISLDTPVGEEGDTRVGDLIEDTDVLQATDVVEYDALAQELRAVIDTLPPREAMIITLRYGLHDGRPHALQEVADRLGLTRERIRQLERTAMQQLRSPERSQPLLAWAG